MSIVRLYNAYTKYSESINAKSKSEELGLPELSEALRAFNQLKERGVIEDYAIGGGQAIIYHSVPLSTYDLDLFVILRNDADYHAIYQYFREKGNKIEDEYIYIDDMAVQILPNISPLFNETVEQAHKVIIEGIPSKVARVEYLIVIALGAFRPKDKYHILQIKDKANKDLLDKILDRFDDTDGKLRKRYKSILARA